MSQNATPPANADRPDPLNQSCACGHDKGTHIGAYRECTKCECKLFAASLPPADRPALPEPYFPPFVLELDPDDCWMEDEMEGVASWYVTDSKGERIGPFPKAISTYLCAALNAYASQAQPAPVQDGNRDLSHMSAADLVSLAETLLDSREPSDQKFLVSIREELKQRKSAQPAPVQGESHLCDCWNELCEQIAQMCEYLGLDRKKDVCDSWGLKGAIIKLRAECLAAKASVAPVVPSRAEAEAVALVKRMAMQPMSEPACRTPEDERRVWITEARRIAAALAGEKT